MKIKRIVFLLLAGAAFFIIYSIVRSNCQWRAENLNNRQWALSRAAWVGDFATVRDCVEAGANVNSSPTMEGRDTIMLPLANAVAMGHKDIVRYLLDHGARPNGTEGHNPLIRLCWDRWPREPSSDLPIAKLLLEHGADPNLREDMSTPLSAARTTGKADLVLLLQHYGAHD